MQEADSRSLDIQCTKVLTERRNHARDFVRELTATEFKKYDAIVTIGGDGMPHEVVNGFCSRPDYKELKLVLGLLPGGSGCALLFNILMERKFQFDTLSSTFLMTRFVLKQKSVFRFLFKPSNEEGKLDLTPVFALLGHLTGFFADVDFGSEKFRCLGNFRFDCYGAMVCCCPGGQKAEITWKRKLGPDRGHGSLKPAESGTGSLGAPLLEKEAADPEDEATKTRTLKEDIYFLNMNMLEYMSRDMRVAPELNMGSDQAAMTIMPKKSGWCKFLCFLLNFGSGKFTEKPKEHGVIHEDFQSLRVKLLPPNAKKGDYKVVVGVDGERYQASELEAQLVQDNTVYFLC